MDSLYLNAVSFKEYSYFMFLPTVSFPYHDKKKKNHKGSISYREEAAQPTASSLLPPIFLQYQNCVSPGRPGLKLNFSLYDKRSLEGKNLSKDQL